MDWGIRPFVRPQRAHIRDRDETAKHPVLEGGQGAVVSWNEMIVDELGHRKIRGDSRTLPLHELLDGLARERLVEGEPPFRLRGGTVQEPTDEGEPEPASKPGAEERQSRTEAHRDARRDEQ